jgi:hypothetical protein
LFLQDERRIASLVFVNVLALMVYSVLELLARRSGMTGVTARQMLEGFEFLYMVMVEFEGGRVEAVVQELSPWQADVIKRLELPEPSSLVSSPAAGVATA